MSIDDKRVPKSQQLSTSYKRVMGGAHPNHFISVYEKTKEEVLSILEDDNMVMAEEIKISVISLQSVRVVLLPYGVFCGRPQKKKRGK